MVVTTMSHTQIHTKWWGNLISEKNKDNADVSLHITTVVRHTNTCIFHEVTFLAVSFAFVICVCKPHCLLGYHCPKGSCVYVCTPFSYLLREPDIGPLYDVTKLIPQHTPNYKWGMPASIKNLITFQAKRVNSAFCTLFHTYTHTHLA